MSLSAILSTANSGLTAAQSQLRVISDNAANVNTPGYIRKIADQQSLTSQGIGSGVEIGRVRLATDRFLQAASLNAGSEATRQEVRYELYDRIQSLFGDPGGDTGFFSSIDDVFASFAATAEDAVSSPRRQEALFKTEALFDEAARISTQIQATREDADARLLTAVERANSLIKLIDDLNVEISRSTAVNTDATGAQGNQAKLVAELGNLLDVRVTPQSNGGVSLRTAAGALLVGPGAATIEYRRAGVVSTQTAFGDITITEPTGQKRTLGDIITTGEIKGLLELRDVDAPETAERLAELMTRVADQLNRAHNANSAVPAPTTLTGRNVGQTLESAISGFTGQTAVAITRSDGTLQHSVRIEFAGDGFRIDDLPASPATYPAADFVTRLNAALTGFGTADFTNGVLSISATDAGNGVVVSDPGINEDLTVPPPPALPPVPTPLSDKAGRGFSHFFGLNDLITADRPALYETGLASDAEHGFAAGGTVKFRFSGDNGARLRDLTFVVPAGATTMDQLVTALNHPVTGVGRYGLFSLAPNGALTFAGSGDPPARLSALEDATVQVPSGISLTELFGIGGGARASRADSFAVRADISRNSAKLALAQIDLGATGTTPALLSGDGRGAAGLADAGGRATVFQTAGDARGGDQTVSRYAAELSGAIGGKAAAAKTRAESAAAVQSEAQARQTSFEGVNLDEELVLMTTYQQAFNASARMIQAARDMYDILLGMV